MKQQPAAALECQPGLCEHGSQKSVDVAVVVSVVVVADVMAVVVVVADVVAVVVVVAVVDGRHSGAVIASAQHTVESNLLSASQERVPLA